MMKRDGEFVSGVKVIVLCHGDKLNAAIHVIDVQAKQFALDVLLDGSKQALIDREMYFAGTRVKQGRIGRLKLPEGALHALPQCIA
ncbi:MAG: hypothetical protein GY774_22210 [Planctomycetes bacterium]|nr:hypothetical protein [Planctomycetota bacterium]|tara:strand:+ start:2362 stop:2619 length:258 start_codon:yes stop_codon:yes gene_type:complete